MSRNRSARRLVVFFSFLSLVAGTAAAGTVQWYNAVSGNWNDPTKWYDAVLVQNRVPGPGDTALINLTGTYTITVNVTSTVDAVTVTGAGAVLAMPSNLTLTTGASTIASGTTLNINGGTLSVGGTLTLGGTLNFTGGTLIGGGTTTVGATGVVNIPGTAGNSYTYITTHTLTNNGTINYPAPTYYLSLYNGATLNNAGTFNATGNQILYQSGAGNTFNNSGTFTKSTGTGLTDIYPVFTNSGIVNVQTGTLELSNSATHTGTFNVSSGALLDFNGGTHSLSTGAAINGAGAAEISTGALDVDAALSFGITTLRINGGTLGGTANRLIVNTLDFFNGTITGTGVTTIDSTGIVNIPGTAGNSYTYITTHTLTNNGTINYPAPTYYLSLYNGATLNNAGTFNATGNQILYQSGAGNTFNNSGTFTKSTGTGLTDIYPVFTNSGIVNVQTGTLELSSSATHTGTFNVSSGALLDFNGGTHSLLTGAAINGAGATEISTGALDVDAALSFGIATLRINGGTLGGTANRMIVNTLDFFNGTITGTGVTTIDSTGIVNIPGTAGNSYTYITAHTLTNNGTINYPAPTYYLSLYSGSTLNNAGTFNATGDQLLYQSGSGNVFNNSGTFTKSVGTGTTDIYFEFHNTGIVDVQSGILLVRSNGTHTGSFNADAGATFRITSGTHTFGASSSITGAGTFSVAGGIATISSGTYSVANTSVSGGTLNMNVAASLGSLSMTGGTFGGTGAVVVTGNSTFSGGTMTGSGTTTINSGVTLNVTPVAAYPTLDARTLTNNGTITHGTTPYYFQMGNGAVLNNAGTFDLQADEIIYAYGTPANTFNNSGTFTKSAGAGVATMGPVFNNSATVTVVAGELELNNGGTSSGSFSIASGATLDFLAGNSTVTGGISGAGTARFSGGTTTLSGTYTVTNTAISNGTHAFNHAAAVTLGTLTMTGGTLTGSGAIVLGGNSTFSGGTMTGSGTTTVNSGVTLNVTPVNAYPALDARTLTNNGTITYGTTPYYFQMGNGAVLNNAGTFDLQADETIYAYGTPANTFNNSGTFTKSAGTGVATMNPVFNNSATATVVAGELELTGGGTSSGSFSISSGASLDFLAGNSTVTGSISGAGTARFSGGTTTLSGTYTVTNTAISNGTHAFNHAAAVTLGTLTMTGGTLTGSGAIVLGGNSTFSGGTMTGSGTTTVNSGVTLNVTPVNAYPALDARTLTNNGTITYGATPYYFQMGNGAVLNNAGTFDLQADEIIYAYGSPASAFNNSGTFNKSAGTGVGGIYPPFNNSGGVTVAAGELEIHTGGTSSGSFNVSSGAALDFVGGTSSLTGTSSISGAGTLRFTGGTNTLSGTLNITGGIVVTGGTSTIGGTVTAIGPTLTVSGGIGTFNHASPFTLSTLTMTNGTLGGSGSFVLGGNSTFSGGTMTGSGTTTVNSGVTLNVTPVNAYPALDARTLTNNGTITYGATPYYFQMGNGAVLNNAGTFDLQADEIIYAYGSPASAFNNSGTFNKSAGTGVGGIYPPFNNSGGVTVAAGELEIHTGGTSSGSFNVSSGATLDFVGGTSSLTGTSSISGAGTLRFTGGTNTLSGTLNITGGIVVTGGTSIIGGTVTAIGPTLTVSGGTGTFNHASPFTLSTLTMTNGTLGGSGSFVLGGNSTFSGGTMTGSGTTTVNSGVTLNVTPVNAYPALDGRTLTNNGTITYGTTPYYFQLGNGAILNNAGTFDLQADEIIYTYGSPASAFNNSGTFTKSAGTGVGGIYSPFSNSGGVTVAAGELEIHTGGTSSGSFNVSSGATLDLVGGTSNLTGTSSISGAGALRFTGGTNTLSGTLNITGGIVVAGGNSTIGGTVTSIGPTLTVSGGTGTFNHASPFTLSTLTMTNGTLGGSGSFVIGGNSTFSGGTMTGSGTTTVDSGVTLNVTPVNAYPTLDGRTLTNNGTITYGTTPYYFQMGNGAVLNNAGTFDLQADEIIYAYGSPANAFNNSGTFTKSAGTGSPISYIYPPFTNTGAVTAAAGELNFNGGFTQTAGTTTLAGGALGGTINLQGGTLGGPGSINGNVSNSGGQMNPGASPGVIAINGNYTQSGTGVLNAELNGLTAGTQYDQLTVTGTATLGGTLNVVQGFAPADGNTFTILTYGSRSGDFATKNGMSLGGGRFLQPNYTGSALILAASPAQTNDVAVDFSTLSNPNGIWSYGWEPFRGGTFTLLDATTSTSGYDYWYTSSIADLSVGRNSTAAPITLTTWTLPAGKVGMHPGPSGQNSVVRWTATAAGTYRVQGAFTGIDFSYPTTTDVAVLKNNSTQLFTANIASYNTPSPFSVDVTLAAGDTIEFTVGHGGNGYSGDATQLDAQILALTDSDLSITKTGTASTTLGGAISYTLQVSNAGPLAAPLVSVTDTLPAGTTFVSATGTNWSCSQLSGTVTCNFSGNLAVGTAPSITIQVTAPATPGTITNTASVSSQNPDPNGTNNSASASTAVAGQANLSLTKTDSADPVNAGTALSYTITVTNAGPNAASAVTVTDTLPAGVAFVSASGTGWSCSQASGTVTCTMASLAVGSTTITINVTAPAAGGTITNTASVTASTSDPVPTNNTASQTTTVTPRADLSIAKTDSADPVATSGSFSYTITVTNGGPSAATSLSVTDTLPAGVALVSASGAGWSCSGTTTVTCTMTSLASGATGTIALNVTAPASPGTITNTASVSAATADPSGANNNATQSTTVSGGVADVAVLKSGPASASVGSTIAFTISVKNVGSAPASNVSVSDPTPAGLSFVSNSGDCTTAFPCAFASLAAGATKTITATYQVLASSPASVTNTATATSSSADANGANNTASASVSICPAEITSTNPVTQQPDVPTSGTLRWNATGADTYRVYLGIGDGGCSILLGTTSDTFLDYRNLQPGVRYTWKVVSVKGSCEIAGPCKSFTTAGIPCEAPQLLSPENGATEVVSPVTFSWTAAAGATGYRLFAVIGSEPPVLLAETSGTSAVAEVPQGASVAWYVEAQFPNCPPIASLRNTFTTRVSGVCDFASPRLLSPTNGAAGLSSPITVDWDGVGGAIGYRVWVGVGDSFPVIVASTTTETTATALVPSGSLKLFVQALFDGCPPTISAVHEISVNPRPNCPTTSATLVAPAQGAQFIETTEVEFEWAPVSEAIGYALWFSIDGDTPTIYGKTSAGTTKFKRLVPAGSIDWFVETFFDACDSTRSAIRRVVILPRPPCEHDAPRLTSPANGATDLPSLVEFTWTAVAGANEYRVWVRSNGTEPVHVGSTTVETTLLAAINGSAAEAYVEALFDGCPSTESARITFTLASAPNCNNGAPQALAPANGANFTTPDVTLTWSGVPNAVAYEAYVSFNEGTPTLIELLPATQTSLALRLPVGRHVWRVDAVFSGCTRTRSIENSFTVALPPQCPVEPALLVAPDDGLAGLTSPVQFAWNRTPEAIGYRLMMTLNEGPPRQIGETLDTTTLTAGVPVGQILWWVEALFAGGCPALESPARRITVVPPPPCGIPPKTIGRVVETISPFESFVFSWNPSAGATIYEVEHIVNPPGGGSPQTTVDVVTGNATTYQAGAAGETHRLRVRPIADCNQERGAYSESRLVRVTEPLSGTAALISFTPSKNGLAAGDANGGVQIVLDRNNKSYDLSTTASEATKQLVLKIANATAPITVQITSDQPWLTIEPSTVTVPPSGATVTLHVNYEDLPVGASNASILVSVLGKGAFNGGTPATIPASVTLSTPVSATPATQPPPTAIIVPAVAHADGQNSKWISDIRLTNVTPATMRYELNFTPSGLDGNQTGKQTTLEVPPGRTLALNDILKTSFDGGEIGQGVLEIRPLNVSPSSFTSVVSSRTYNQSAAGTYGQFIPGIPFSKFVGVAQANKPSTTLSIQQIAQSAAYRTNFGLVEAAGKPVNALMSVFSSAGQKVGEIPIALKAGEQKQFNSLLAANNIALDDGRVEIKMISGEGRVSAYASVVDNRTNDPLLVPAVQLATINSSKFVVPGVADLTGAGANWRTDMRLLNASTGPVTANLTFYPQGNPSQSVTRSVTIRSGEVSVLDNVLATTFGVTNAGGAVHVSTTDPTALVATARTYDRRADGTFGQFVPAITAEEATGFGGRPLQVLQLEESSQFRANLGLAEVSGKPVTVEISAIVPDSTVAPKMTVQLQPNEFRQLNQVMKQLGLGTVYNGRVSVRVLSGQGRVSAYGSIIDNQTQDPTYVPAQ